MKKKGSILVRVIGLVVLIGLAEMVVVGPVKEKRLERRVRTMLLEVQEGLQNFHIDEELYPKDRMTGKELVVLLEGDEYMAKGIRNPWSGEIYVDSTGADWLKYSTDSLAETYELTVLYPNSEEVQFRLDSTEHQSLEE